MEGAAQDPAEKEAAPREGQRAVAAPASPGEQPEGQLAGGVCPGIQAPASDLQTAPCAPALSGSECFSSQTVLAS